MDATVDIFYGIFLLDDTISHLFATTNMKKKRMKQKAFLALAFGGPNNYSSLDMCAAHAPYSRKRPKQRPFQYGRRTSASCSGRIER